MQTIPIDLSALTPEERQQFAENPFVLSPGCETVCCLYMRYSSDRQTEQSIEGQLRELIAYCRHHNYRVAAVYVDRAISAHASMDRRPAFQRMLSDSAKAPWKTVLVYKLDRFARNREDSAIARMRLRKNGCTVESAKEGISKNPEGVILEALLEGMAEYYSLELSQKVRRGMSETARKGNSTGGTVPLGYKTEGKRLQVDPLTAPLVQEAFRRYADGDTVASICDDFNARGYRSAKGAMFNKSSFKNIFRNEKYIGIYKFDDVRTENAVPRIVSDELWNAVQSRLKVNAQAPARGKAKVPYLLAGKIFCGHCGAPMTGECGRGKGGRTYNYYSCATRKRKNACHKKPVQKDWIEDIVAQDAVDVLTDENIEFVAEIAAQQSEEDIKKNTQIPAIRSQIADLESKIRNLTKAIETASVTPDAIITRIAELESQKKSLSAQLVDEERGVIPLTKEAVIFFLQSVREKAIPLETQKHTLIEIFIDSVTVYDTDPGYLTLKTAYRLTNIPSKTTRIPISPCSDLGSYGSPLDANPNTITVVGMVFIQTKRHALP
nr:MAG TPA: integrase [Caudoviricetes sp.]